VTSYPLRRKSHAVVEGSPADWAASLRLPFSRRCLVGKKKRRRRGGGEEGKGHPWTGKSLHD